MSKIDPLLRKEELSDDGFLTTTLAPRHSDKSNGTTAQRSSNSSLPEKSESCLKFVGSFYCKALPLTLLRSSNFVINIVGFILIGTQNPSFFTIFYIFPKK